MKTAIYWVLLNEILLSFCLRNDDGNVANRRQTVLNENKQENIFLRRPKRFLVFEKGASITANLIKSLITPSPKGLNVIAEYTLTYDLPTDFRLFEIKREQTTERPVTPPHPLHTIIPYSPDYSQYFNSIQRKYVNKQLTPQKCRRRNLYDTYRRKFSKFCLKRFKRDEESVDLTRLTISQRMFYDLIEKWSLIHGFLPRYCFMRTLCESSQLLLPYGHSLLHDIVHIMLRYTKPWAFHHKIFGRSLRQRYPIDECAKLYGSHCRTSWLDFITNAVQVSSRDINFMHQMSSLNQHKMKRN